MARRYKILIVDDDPLVLESLDYTFHDEYDVLLASSGEQAVDLAKDHDDLDTVVLDIRMAKMDGLETTRRIKEINPNLPVVFFTAYPGDYYKGQIERDYRPFEYVTKDERPARLKQVVRDATMFHRLGHEKKDLVGLARDEYGIVGKSRTMLEVYKTIEKIAPTDSKVVIIGPTGTGKELVACAIHKRSRRADKRFAIMNCSHKSGDLVQSELFGHLRGSFTGAIADRIGLFEYADRGTLFLDEIGDLNMATQVKLLRILENGEIQRVGSPKLLTVDIRVICATHRNLSKMVSEGQFREDLYYRLGGVTITLPALRDRREDIPELIDFFVERCCLRHGHGLKLFEPAAEELLIEYDWPGNIRQLLDTIESLLALSPSSFITSEEVSEYLGYTGTGDAATGTFKEQVREIKKLVLIRALARNNNNIAATARELRLDRSNLYKMLRDLGIDIG